MGKSFEGAATPSSSWEFVTWEETALNYGDGREDILYYLKRRDGTSTLAITVQDKSLRAKSYVWGLRSTDIRLISGSSSRPELRSRTDVVSWLNSVVEEPPQPIRDSSAPKDARALDSGASNVQLSDDATKARILPNTSTPIQPLKKRPGLEETSTPEVGCHNEESRVRNDLQHLTVDSKVEVLSQVGPIRGCWHRATIIKRNNDKVKVRYQDFKDEDDESIDFKAWVAIPDPLGIRFSGRATVRPARFSNIGSRSIHFGALVDVWWYNGWWEGIVIGQTSNDRYIVYFPEGEWLSSFAAKSLRQSEEWFGNEWRPITGIPDLAMSILSQLGPNSAINVRKIETDHVATDNDREFYEDAQVNDMSEYKSRLELKWGSRKGRTGKFCLGWKNERDADASGTQNNAGSSMTSGRRNDRGKCEVKDCILFGSASMSPLLSLGRSMWCLG